jgi:NodT family efflux transporter outer membrane factor (OMF) lipoprotein
MLKFCRLPCLPLLLLLAGCSLHQPTRVDPPAIPAGYLEPAGATPGEPLQRWWQEFRDPALNHLMEELFSGNLQLDQVYARLDQAVAAARSAGAARYPVLTLAGEGGRSMQPGVVGEVEGNNLQGSLAASFEIDLWGRLKNRQQAAGYLQQASLHELQTLYLGLTAQLADLYYQAVDQRSQLALTDATINSFRDTVTRVGNRYRQGLAPALDLYQARQSLSAAEAARPRFENSLAATEHALAVLLGRYPDRSSAGSLAELPTLQQQFPAGLPGSLLQRRPDVAASFARLRAADAEIAVALADRLPSLSLLGSAGYLDQDSALGALKGNFWNLAGQLALPLVDGGRRRAEVERTRAVLQERVAAYRQSVLDAYREVEDALAANRTGEERVLRLAETKQATEAALRLSLQRYLYGVSDYLPVLTAQRNHFQTQSELLSARRQLIASRISLARALGGDWMNDMIEQRTTALQGEQQP